MRLVLFFVISNKCTVNIIKVYSTTVFNYTRKRYGDVYFMILILHLLFIIKSEKKSDYYIIVLMLECFCMWFSGSVSRLNVHDVL